MRHSLFVPGNVARARGGPVIPAEQSGTCGQHRDAGTDGQLVARFVVSHIDQARRHGSSRQNRAALP
jgi:hypothetical protein